jgi:uncharacterized protein YukE
MSELRSLQTTRDFLQGMLFAPVPFELKLTIDAALAPAPLPGSPAAVRAQAQAYAKAAEQCQQVSLDIRQVATSSLPSAWRGQVAENASQAVTALSAEIGTIESHLSQAAGVLNSWAELLEWAQAKDADGVAQLKSAQKLASGSFNPFSASSIEALKQALAGVDTRIAAFQTIADQSPKTVSLLNQFTSQARAQDVATGDLDPLSAVELATVTDPGGTADSADILTPTALSRASQRLDALSAADQAAFQKLLSGAKSPQEAAYLYKALAAGYNLQQIDAFAAAIHPHGDDPTWLAEHLTPNLENDTSQALPTEYEGVSGVSGWGYTLYSQGGVNDCVAASTVIAQASLDPVLTLSLTTGYGQPKGSTPAPGDDSPAALQQRLQQIYQKEYAVGRSDDSLMEQWFGSSSGIYSDGGQALENSMLSNSTGTSYQYHGLGDASSRQAVIPKIEAAVDSGKPVPFQVTNGSDGHQMVIIGHNGDQFEVYNPWGFAQWVSESQFVNGDLGALTQGAADGKAMPTADGVDLPQ